MNHKGFTIRPLVQAVAAAALLSSASNASHAAEASMQLEEVVVTAQKRVENLQDVPVSVSAVSGEKMYEAGIDRLEGLQSYVPNLTMTETGIGTNIYIRGIGSGINQGFEQSVGMYVDGIYHGRAQLTRAPFLDLERVEVLRGPQMILFGKNSIAGAIDLHTAKPSDEFQGEVTASYEPEYGSKELTGVVSGPLTDKVGGRLALRKFETDGYIENLTSGKDEPSRDEQSVRGTLSVAFTEQLEATLKLQHDSFDNKGRQIEIITANPGGAASPAPGATFGQFLAVGMAQDPSVMNEELDYKRSSNGDSSENNVTSAALQFDYSFDDDSQLTFISGYLAYDYDEMCDCDFTGANTFTLQSQEDYKQYSQEVRFSSPIGQSVEYIVGGYLQSSELDFNDNFRINNTSTMGPVMEQKFIDAGKGPGFGQAILGTASPRELTQDSSEWSLFAQATWNISERFRAIAGGRYSEEKKEAEKTLRFGLLDGSLFSDPVQAAMAAAVFNNAFQVYEMDLKDERKKSNFAPMVTLQYDLNDDIMGYVTIASGFKSGGFDARSNNVPAPGNVQGSVPGTFEFDDEEALSYEAGFKSRLLGGRATLNAALYRTEYDDLQVSVFDGTLGFNVGNAASAVSQGFELDGRFRATEYLTFGSSIAYLDFEFGDYDSGPCRAFETPSSVDGTNCNRDGETNQYVSPWTANLMTEYARPLGDSGLELMANLDLLFKDSYYTAGNLEEDTKQGAYTMINARLGIGAEDGSWDVALVGKNLSDREVVSYSADTPLATTFGYKSQYGFVEAPRTVALQGGYRF
ncbi:outer membrane receptor protein involved in Fe transport [Sinobacterium caligoides]|uniref:Outer membrane receptor protein involved in Fe transport n=1 Tax=Sinobacterium caligoides TaxID=933926 RepID=A0A3N2DGC6_9GAMM|nr:TonB-dependent receptor [Sinobacterium caligoides]ROR98718.1 outer membrane receptor protein involved in Fe transport [Sinobacterium caligoides]